MRVVIFRKYIETDLDSWTLINAKNNPEIPHKILNFNMY